MKINTKPENVAEYKNITSVNEFKIKSNFHSFQILSSGLYANKIRAIIRELSCNAWDSHVAANNVNTPFDLHLPNSIEPYFSIRDYGTGLTHEEVVNIYTTYFESTKSDSNDFIGALGLGSKSPFSYTENFTVTAIKDGVKSIYTAFVSEQGVPSVARMADLTTDEPNGVEVKFAVENTYDFSKFENEAKYVLTYFKVKPNFTGRTCSVFTPEYEEVNIVDNINVMKYSVNNSSSVAIMGNIAYPIDVPNKENNLGNLAELLRHNLEITFNIGDVEFQASREGLSYTAKTINSIKEKLQSLQNRLDYSLEKEVAHITNEWELCFFLFDKYQTNIWKNSVINYIKNNVKSPLIKNNVNYFSLEDIYLLSTEIENKYNVSVRHIKYDSYSQNFRNMTEHTVYDNKTGSYVKKLSIEVDTDTVFVKYDKKHGALQHVKHHFKHNRPKHYTHIYILYPATKDKEADYDGFFKAIHNPPNSHIVEMSNLIEKPKVFRNTVAKNKDISILRLEKDSYRNSYTWKQGSLLSHYDTKTTHFYIPLSGYSGIWKDGYEETDIKSFVDDLNTSGIDHLLGIKTVYGIRKSDIEKVIAMKNWVNIQEYLIDKLESIDKPMLIPYVFSKNNNYGKSLIKDILPSVPDTDFAKYFDNADLSSFPTSFSKLSELYKRYTNKTNIKEMFTESVKEFNAFMEKYPLILYADYGRYYTQQQIRKDCINLINLIENKTQGEN